MWELLNPFQNAATFATSWWYPVAHFGLGFLAAALPCWLILTICRFLGIPERRTYPWLLSLALSLGVLSHIWEDYAIGLF